MSFGPWFLPPPGRPPRPASHHYNANAIIYWRVSFHYLRFGVGRDFWARRLLRRPVVRINRWYEAIKIVGNI